MDVRFKYNEPAEAEKIYFEQIFAEKPGGGVVKWSFSNIIRDIPPTTPVIELPDGRIEFEPQFTVLEDVEVGSTTINIELPYFKCDDFTFFSVGYKDELSKIASAKETEHGIQLTVENPFSRKITKGTVLWVSYGKPEPNPNLKYVTGDWVYANQGDQAVRLINGANLRKETANIASEVAALLPGINLV
jgi:hypothetical protein